MVSETNLNRSALISLYDKSDIEKLCEALTRHKINIISTGGSAKKIKSLGFKCKEISSLTKFKEILDGRVKTINPKIHGSILFKRNDDQHIKEFKKLNFPQIDFVIVNFYPFSKVSDKKNLDKKIEMIDIGGPSMIRSASKNFEFVTTICEKKYYSSLIKQLDNNHGHTTLNFRKRLAKDNFKLTSNYDLSIFNWFNNKSASSIKTKFSLKYGENPNQKAYFIKNTHKNIFNSKISGKELGYNNILDISEGLNCLKEFRSPTSIIIKHNNPCGIASAQNINTAYKKALASDPVSAFGGILLLNKKIDNSLARQINLKFYEAIIAPDFDMNALEILKSKKNLIIINSSNLKKTNNFIFRSVNSGTLYQEENNYKITKSKIKLVSKKIASRKTVDDLIFAYKVAKHIKSNAIVLVSNQQTIGIGAGQMSRLDSTKIAIMKYNNFFKNKNFVCASDAFFPFTDNIKLLLESGCKAIIQPNGSKNDDKIIKFAKNNNVSLYFIKNRVFKH